MEHLRGRNEDPVSALPITFESCLAHGSIQLILPLTLFNMDANQCDQVGRFIGLWAIF